MLAARLFFAATLAVVVLPAACAASGSSDAGDCPADVAADKTGGPRLCHANTYWDIARRDPPGGSGSHSKSGLIDWFSKVEGSCNEVMISRCLSPSAASSKEGR